MRLTANYKKSYHKSVGKYISPERCNDCVSGSRRPRSQAARRDKTERVRRTRQAKKAKFDELPLRDMEPRELITDLTSYQRSVTERYEGNTVQVTRQVHLERHLDGSPHSLTSVDAARAIGLRRPKSPTSLATADASVDELLSNVASFAASTDPDMVREYKEGKSIIRVVYTGQHDGLEISVLRPRSGEGYELVSSYDGVPVEKALDNLKARWK